MTGAITVIHEPTAAEPFAVVFKPAGLPSAPLHSLDEESAYSEAARLFPNVKKVRGKKEIEGGLLHRIDSQTAGLLLIAESQDFYEHIAAAQARGDFIKGYLAECAAFSGNARALGGFPPAPFSIEKGGLFGEEFLDAGGAKISSRFRHYGKGRALVRPVVLSSPAAALKKTESPAVYSTSILSVQKDSAARNGRLFRVECRIARGFRHQVRCHLAWIGLPVTGDPLYNALENGAAAPGSPRADGREKSAGGGMRFYAASLDFPDLFSDKSFSFSLGRERFR